MSDLNISGPVMVGLNGDEPTPVQVDENGAILTSGGIGGNDVNIVGDTVGLAKANQLPTTLLNNGLRVSGYDSATATTIVSNALKNLSIVYGWDTVAATLTRINATSNALNVSNQNDGVQGTGMSPPAGGSGIIGFLSGIFNVITALLSRTRSTFAYSSSGSIAVGGTAQTFLTVATRNYLAIHNVSDGDLWVKFNVNAVIGDLGSILIKAGDRLVYDVVCPSNSMTIIGATTGQKFTVITG
jgi:hypothetical protein